MGETTLFVSGRTRVVRFAGPDGASLVRKELSGPGAGRRLRHETSVLRRLAGLPGVPELIGTDDGRPTLVLADGAFEPLPAAPVPVAEVIRLAAGVAGVIAALHGRGVIHKDINPSNIMLAGPDRAPVLIDYDLAGTYPVERPSFTHHTDLSGTLAYLAPEQTGRTGWPVDQRADLYAFGATLYELATGRPPFGDGDPLQLVHDHLTRRPDPPVVLVPELPGALSMIICRLLEKDPERRYQSAEGVLHDLVRLRDRGEEEFPLGERDFPFELSAPSRLVGREAEVARLGAALDGAVRGTGAVVLVSGPSGVGKTALIDELRPLVTAAGGWFVSGKYDQFRQDPDADGLRLAFRGIGRMLLAEPEEELLRLRARLRADLGGNAALLAAAVPEFASLLEVVPDTAFGELLHVQARLNQAGMQVLRVVADPRRPLVVVVDDLQWAQAALVGLFDELVGEADLRGILFVGAYRDAEVGTTHPLAPALVRWRHRPDPPPYLRLAELPESGIRELAEGMLRDSVDRIGELVELIGAHTGGNPFATVEFLNALRRGGALTHAEGGWRFDPGASWLIGRPANVAALLAAQVRALPRASKMLIEILSCLSGDVDPEIVESFGDRAADVLEILRPALEAGMLTLDGTALQFRHDQIRQAVYDGMSSRVRIARHLRIARRLFVRPGYAMVAAEQYMAALAGIASVTEAYRVSGLLREAAVHTRAMANYESAERFLGAAAVLVERAGARAADPLVRWRLDAERQEVLLAMGRLDEAEQLYRRIDEGCPDPLIRAGSALTRMSALVMQNRPVDALAVGCASLAELGCPVPGVDELAERGPHLADELAAWSREGDAEADLSRDRDTDPITAALGNLMNRMVPAAFFIGSPLTPWLVLTAARIWTESGPSPALAGTLAHAAFVCVPLRGDYRTAYAVVSRMLTVSDAMGREPDASFVRFVHALSTAAWFEPLPDVLQHARIAHERLVGAGDLYSAGFTWYTSSPIVLDCDSLATHQAEAERGIVFATTTANDQVAQVLRPHRAIGEALSGPEPATPADEDGPRPETAGNPQAEASFHLMSAFIALILGDRPALARHAPEAIARSRFFGSGAVTVLANLVRALSYSDEIRAAPEPERARLLAAFDRHHAWIAARAADAPGNFGHLDSWLRAERAWAVDDFAATVRLFDRAEYDTEGRPRPWHRALLAERRARFLMANGVECAGRIMLHHAVERYRSWGAERKVVALREEFPFLEADVVPQRQEPLVSAQTIDLLAVLRVCQAISSETAVDRLTEQVNDLLCGLTGATAARLVLRDPDTGDWFLPVDADAPLPFTVLRYVERTREPLLVDDAKRDDRFAHDPFLRTLERLALLVVPILTGGEPTAILVLENEVSRGAFGLNRLETVSLLAGQLSVSLNNALLYAALERKVADRTQALAEANAKLEILAATDPLTGLPNRRRLEESLGRRPAAVAMIDIDHFKLYNDRYGHQAGDECLRRVAHVIGANVRESDVVVRYGGEEFAVILDNADEVTALAVAERIRAAVEDLAEPHDAAPRGRVTVSIGVAAGDPATGTAPDDLLGAADACLYAAKAAGRNGVRS